MTGRDARHCASVLVPIVKLRQDLNSRIAGAAKRHIGDAQLGTGGGGLLDLLAVLERV
jgi:hypothetical protein